MKELIFSENPLPSEISYLNNLSFIEARHLIYERYAGWDTPFSSRKQQIQPRLHKEEGWDEYFLDTLRRYPHELQQLRDTFAFIVEELSIYEVERIDTTKNMLGDVMALCAATNNRKSMSAIKYIAANDEFENYILDYGETLQNRALRCLSGLLTEQDVVDDPDYREVFERAVGTREHVQIGLTTLCSHWPEEKDTFITEARKHITPENEKQVEWIVAHLDTIKRILIPRKPYEDEE